MENIDIYCVTNKKVPFLEDSFLKLGAVGNDDFNERYIKCDSKDNIFNKDYSGLMKAIDEKQKQKNGG